MISTSTVRTACAADRDSALGTLVSAFAWTMWRETAGAE
jgi:hypothetical protein